MNNSGVKDAFDKSAMSYDRARRQLIPCFDDFYGTALDLIPFKTEDEFNLLDLGAGTGLLSALIHERFPKAHITLSDISEKMLERARERFRDCPDHFDYVVADYTEGIRGKYDCIVSALSIHHLTGEEKRRLFRDIREALPEDGLFINADQALGATPEIEKTYREVWMAQVKISGLPDPDIAAARERLKEDKMDPLNDQLLWLKNVGFRQVNCWYQNYSFMVCSAQK